MPTTVSRQDSRFKPLERGNNLRWPVAETDTVSRIEFCQNPDEVAEALQRTVRGGLRPTVRSGGHCYEDFVSNNPGGVLIDVSQLTDMDASDSGHTYKVGPGTRLGDAYTRLYKDYGVTLPGGSCYGVGAGGHISGGGYGLLSRLHGLVVDWVSAIDILTVDAKGDVTKRRIDSAHDPDLFRACRGAGGNNFGIITAYYFDKMPAAPREVVNISMGFPWEEMTPQSFETILTTYGHYLETRGKDPDTWGLFTFLGLSHRSSGGIEISAQFCNPDGTCDDLRVLHEFIDLFQPCKPVATEPQSIESRHTKTGPARILTGPDGAALPCSGPQHMNKQSWYSATVRGGVGGGTRAKYKSTYMKSGFTRDEARIIYKHLTREIAGAKVGGILAVDSYGGAVNRPEMAAATAVSQRSSVLTLQFQSYWKDPKEDAGHLQWMRDFYTDLYSGPDADPRYKGTPFPNQQYEGCYINYPDADLLAYPFWPQLYYGNGDLYPFLQSVKRKYDPNNIFHHAMSVRG